MGSIPAGNVLSGLIRKYSKSIRFFHFRYDFGLVSSQPFDDHPIEYTPRGEDKYGECLCTNFDFVKDVVPPINKLQKMFPV